jgi:3-oxoacyl-(acyl-carrier-protein) synthase/acyl carrier protein
MKTLKDYLLEQVANKNLPAEEAFNFLKQLDATPAQVKAEIAVLGMACRLPGANTPDQLWKNLLARKDLVDAFPKNRMDDVKYVNKKIYEETKGLNCRIGTYLNQIDLFDNQFFGFTPAEARVMDPSQRIFLEVAMEALESAGLTEDDLKGSKTAIYVGYSVNDDNYIDILAKDDPNVLIGNQPAMLAYRLSFMFDLRGPTMLIDTSCSSSLVAIHEACKAIENGDCDQAIVGGVNLRTFPAIREIANLGIEAFDGRCKTFDEKANGTNIGEGIAAIVIKRKDLAEKNGDPIIAIIKGTAVNSDGTSNGITSPNPEAQSEVITKAWERAGINPEQLTFIESHGTGTKLGDPIEINGLTHAFKKHTQKTKICPLGAIKTNIGHLEAAAGITGFIKTVLCLQHRQLPANIHYHKPNPFIDFGNSAVYPNTILQDWKNNKDKLIAGLSSFGISGTNCHVVIEENTHTIEKQEQVETQTLFFSAKSTESLKMNLASMLRYLQTAENELLPHISYTLAKGRNHYNYRCVIAAATVKESVDIITNILENLGEGHDFTNIHANQFVYNDVKSGKSIVKSNISIFIDQYLIGKPILWKNLFTSKNLTKLNLPTYAFNSKRHWPKLEVEKKDDLQARLKSLYYEVQWKREDKQEDTQLKVSHETWIFFVEHFEEHVKFVSLCSDLGLHAIKVYPGITFQQHDSCHFTIDPKRPEHYTHLLELVLKMETAPLKGMMHLWDCKPLSNTFSSYENVSNSQDLSSFSGFHWIRACGEKYPAGDFRWITLTSYAQKIDGLEKDFDPTRMPSLGLNKVISQEFPKVKSLAIDIDFDNFNERTGSKIIQEIFNTANYSDPCVGYRKGERYVQILERMDIDKLTPAKFTIREQGVYLIAGGAGYLGLESALYLSRRNKVKIALIGRKEKATFSEKQKRLIKQIEDSGSTIHYMSGNITDENQCSAMIDEVKSKLGLINGIIVAVKNVSHELIEKTKYETFRNNVLSKLRSTWLLDQLTKDHNPDFMATFSSISSLTGGPTGADCCASNLFLDSFGDWRNMHHRTTTTMNFTLIEADDGSLLSDRMSMIPPLTKEEYLACFDLFLTKTIPFALVADFDNHVMSLVLPFMKIRFSDNISRHFMTGDTTFSMNASTKTEYSLEDIKNVMSSIWKDILGYTEISESANFFDIGGDSISAVKLIHLVKIQLHTELDVADLYSYSTFDDMCQYVQDKTHNKTVDQISQLLKDIDSGKIDLLEAVELIK